MSDYTVRKLNQCRLYNLPIAMSIPTIQDLSIVLTAPNHNPTLLNPDFLTGTGIIPTDWELARPPVISTQGSQIAFKNGVTFLAQPGAITFSQSFAEATPETLDIPTIARKYATTLANLDYQAVSINPKQFVPFEHHPDGHLRHAENDCNLHLDAVEHSEFGGAEVPCWVDAHRVNAAWVFHMGFGVSLGVLVA